jgi:hypothetical protein
MLRMQSPRFPSFFASRAPSLASFVTLTYTYPTASWYSKASPGEIKTSLLFFVPSCLWILVIKSGCGVLKACAHDSSVAHFVAVSEDLEATFHHGGHVRVRSRRV